MSRALPMRVTVGLALAIVLDTLAQLSWKWAAHALPDGGDGPDQLWAMLHQPLFLLVVLLLAGQMVNWLKLLNHVDLSFAQPITALSYISVCLLSVLWFGEQLGIYQLLGIGCIMLGVGFISRSGHQTRGVPHELEP